MGTDGNLRSLFRERLPRVHWQSVETGGTGRGIPDSNGCVDGCEFWVEYKQTAGRSVSLRPEQIAWHLRRHRAGGRTFVAVRRTHDGGPRKGPPVDELYLLHGSYAKEIKAGGLGSLPPGSVAGMWSGGPSGWDWDEVLAALMRASQDGGRG